MMTHPQYRPGKPSPEVKSPHGFTYHGIGEPVRFAPVLVKTQQDEEYHASLGYVSQGKCDPAAFDRAVGAGQIPEQVAHKPLEYPKWVLGKLCANAEEEQKVLGGPTMAQIVAEDAAPALNAEVAPEQTADKAQIIALEAKVDKLAALLAKALRALDKMDDQPSAETVSLKSDVKREYPSTFDRVAAAAQDEAARAEAKRRAASKKAKKTRKPVVRTAQQKRDHSEAIKAGLARRKAQLTESIPAEQGGDAPVQ